MEKIIRMLEKEHEAMSINQISQKTGIHNVTVRRYVKIIKLVRNEPLEIIQTRHAIIMRCKKVRKRPRTEDETENDDW